MDINNLPINILYSIGLFIDNNDIINMGLTCKNFYNIYMSSEFLKIKLYYHIKFPHHLFNKKDLSPINRYLQLYELFYYEYNYVDGAYKKNYGDFFLKNDEDISIGLAISVEIDDIKLFDYFHDKLISNKSVIKECGNASIKKTRSSYAINDDVNDRLDINGVLIDIMAESGKWEMVKLLFTKTGVYRYKIIECACSQENVEIMKWFINVSDNLSCNEYQIKNMMDDLFFDACFYGYPEVIRLLLEKGYRPKSFNESQLKQLQDVAKIKNTQDIYNILENIIKFNFIE